MENVSLPSISGQFSYGLEIVDPALGNVISANVRLYPGKRVLEIKTIKDIQRNYKQQTYD